MKFGCKKYVCVCVFLFGIIFILSGCGDNNVADNVNLKSKINSEISYIDGEIVYIANFLNDIDYLRYKVVSQESEAQNSGAKDGESSSSSSESDQSGSDKGNSKGDTGGGGSEEKSKSKDSDSEDTKKIFSMQANNILGKKQSEIDWNDLKNKVENLYISWTTVYIDLKEIGVKEEKLDEFNAALDNVAIAIKSENKDETLSGVVELYKFLPEFMEQYNDNSKEKNLLFTKYNLLLCYKNADEENWDELNSSISNLKMSFSNVYNQLNEYKEKKVNVNNAKVIINEMSNSKDIKEKDIFFVKYKNLIQELNYIM